VPVLPIALQLAGLRMPLKQGLHTAARLGASGVEIDARGEINPKDLSATGLRHLRKMLEDLNLRVSAVSFATRRGYNVMEDLDRRVEATKQAMQFAFKLGASVVTNSVGQIPADHRGGQWETLIAVLTEIGRFGERAGARLAARTGGESADTLASLIAALPEGALTVDFDPGGLVVNGFSPADAMPVLGRHVACFHARDAVRDLARGRGLEVTLGRGSVDFTALLGALEEHGYRGYITIERTTADDPAREYADAVEYIKRLW
jgi:sugar phosphate isomerase/epimerase